LSALILPVFFGEPGKAPRGVLPTAGTGTGGTRPTGGRAARARYGDGRRALKLRAQHKQGLNM
jgi:hypothetical protein